MPKSDSWYKINENAPKNRFILEMIKKEGGLNKLAKKLKICNSDLSKALNKKYMSKHNKLKIAKLLGKDTIEIFDY